MIIRNEGLDGGVGLALGLEQGAHLDRHFVQNGLRNGWEEAEADCLADSEGGGKMSLGDLAQALEEGKVGLGHHDVRGVLNGQHGWGIDQGDADGGEIGGPFHLVLAQSARHEASTSEGIALGEKVTKVLAGDVGIGKGGIGRVQGSEDGRAGSAILVPVFVEVGVHRAQGGFGVAIGEG